MRAECLRRADLPAADILGAVVVSDVHDTDGRIVIERGTRLDSTHRSSLDDLSWNELHLIRLENGDLGEHDAGTRLVRAAAGDGTAARSVAGGHWPIVAERRGVVQVRTAALASVNTIEGLAVYTLPDGQVVDAGEIVARAKILPFVMAEASVRSGESASGSGLVAVRAFQPRRVAAVVQESLGSSALERFRTSFGEKVEWFGGKLDAVHRVAPDVASMKRAMSAVLSSGTDLVVIAGTKAMDPLDPAFGAIAQIGGRVERVGVPAHPGSLLWLARVGTVPLVGMPSCGLFSRATIFDVFLPRFMCGLPVDGSWLVGLGHGGLLTRDMAWRFPPYRPRHDRGAVD
ncbi:MAG TPA: hypothetical protein VF981_16140 [Gemmatimonadaceae bacterium]